MSHCLSMSASGSITSGLSRVTKPVPRMRFTDQAPLHSGIPHAHRSSLVTMVTRAYSSSSSTIASDHTTSRGETSQQSILNSYGFTTWDDRSFDVTAPDESNMPDQLQVQRLKNLWWHTDQQSPVSNPGQHPDSGMGLRTDRPIERLLQQQHNLTLHSHELSISAASQVEGDVDAPGQVYVTVSQSDQPAQQVDTVQEEGNSNGQEDGEDSSDGYGLGGEQDEAPQPMFNNAFRDILASALSRQKVLMQKDEDANEEYLAAAALKPYTPPVIVSSASEEAIATSLAVAKVTLARMIEVRKEMDTAVIRETKQVERLAFALHKIRTDAAYYRTLESMTSRRPDGGSIDGAGY